MLQVIHGVHILSLVVDLFFYYFLKVSVFHTEIGASFGKCFLLDDSVNFTVSVYLTGNTHPPEDHLVAGQCTSLV